MGDDGKTSLHDRLDFSAATWIKTSQNCDAGVEIAFVEGYIAMRNEADPGSVLVFTPSEWDAFVAGAKGGEFDNA